MIALDGIKVLEMAQTPIASFAAMVLGDFGAEVLKVEAPPREGGEMLSTPMGEEEVNTFVDTFAAALHETA